jgi:hypothetical protein
VKEKQERVKRFELKFLISLLFRKPFTAHGKKYRDYVTMSVPKDADSNFRNKNSSYLLSLGVR